jgi:hypothetical protein
VYVPSSELVPSQPLSRQRVCLSPQNRGEGLGESQFRRLWKKHNTLPTQWLASPCCWCLCCFRHACGAGISAIAGVPIVSGVFPLFPVLLASIITPAGCHRQSLLLASLVLQNCWHPFSCCVPDLPVVILQLPLLQYVSTFEGVPLLLLASLLLMVQSLPLLTVASIAAPPGVPALFLAQKTGRA